MGEATENLLWASAGFAHFEMDTRGQGWSGSRGTTADTGPIAAHMPGFLTRGITDPETTYYRRVFTDAARAVEAAKVLDQVDAGRIAVHGISQGGGIALAVAGLMPGLAQIIARVPFLCEIPRALTLTDRPPYREIVDYLAHYRDRESEVMRTLGYIDAVHFAARASAPAQFTVGLMDPVCPPSTVYAAYNAYTGRKQIREWPYNAHEGGGVDDDMLALRTLQESLEA